jgi:hypothetical protein
VDAAVNLSRYEPLMPRRPGLMRGWFRWRRIHAQNTLISHKTFRQRIGDSDYLHQPRVVQSFSWIWKIETKAKKHFAM